MGKRIKRKQVPWEFTDLDNNKLWVWNTQYFEASIMSQGADVANQIFVWKIIDYSTREKRLFDSGESLSFKEASDMILEMIGKSYPKDLGFAEYAGELATTYTIRDHRKIDFWAAVGEEVSVFYQEDHYVKMIHGIFSLNHHDFSIKTPSGVIQIPPHLVLLFEQDSLVGDYLTLHQVEVPKDYKPVPASLIRKKYDHDSATLRDIEDSKPKEDEQKTAMEELMDETIDLIPLDDAPIETPPTTHSSFPESKPKTDQFSKPKPVVSQEPEPDKGSPFGDFDEDFSFDELLDDEEDHKNSTIKFPK